MKAGPWIILIALVTLMYVFPDTLQAQTSNNILDSIITMYRDEAESWRAPIMQAATRLFWLLVGIDFIWTGINLALEKATFEKIVAELIKRIMIIGFFFALLINSGEWAGAIINSFRNLASEAGASGVGGSNGISPSNIFDIGLRIAGELSEQITFSEIGESVSRVIISIVILIAFAFIAGLLLVALVELYIALNAAVILLAFGGSRWTIDYAIKYLSYILSTGMKIFVMQLLIAIGQTFIQNMNTQFQGNITQSLVLLGASVVLCMIVKTIPDYIQSIVSGLAPSSAGNGLITAASAAAGASIGAMTGGMAGGAGGAMAVMEAAKLAGSQASAGGNSKPSLGSLLAGTMKNLGGGSVGDLASSLSQNTMGGRMSSRMKEERMGLAPAKSPESESAQQTSSKSNSSGIPTLND
ncbi:MAG: P-type conjugative transfer protein TrbL [Proteobacteria bacterium]|nr:MAG: P-type conjugative transfer protein TrbL [Pseudomonadota bacterium]